VHQVRLHDASRRNDHCYTWRQIDHQADNEHITRENIGLVIVSLKKIIFCLSVSWL
jgi:hypothetical protein